MTVKETKNYIQRLKLQCKVLYELSQREINNINNYNKTSKELYFNMFKKETPKELLLKERTLKQVLEENYMQIVTLYNLQISKLNIEKDTISFVELFKEIETIFLNCLERITYNRYNNSYSIKFNSNIKDGCLTNNAFIFLFITFLKNLRGENIKLKEFNVLKQEFLKLNFKRYKKHTIDKNISFKTFKNRKVITIYFKD